MNIHNKWYFILCFFCFAMQMKCHEKSKVPIHLIPVNECQMMDTTDTEMSATYIFYYTTILKEYTHNLIIGHKDFLC